VARYVLTDHARQALARRKLTTAQIEAVLDYPQQTLAAERGLKILQNLIDHKGRKAVLRLIVNMRTDPLKVVTIIITTQVKKYWGPD
jgi:hypothetical protein